MEMHIVLELADGAKPHEIGHALRSSAGEAAQLVDHFGAWGVDMTKELLRTETRVSCVSAARIVRIA